MVGDDQDASDLLVRLLEHRGFVTTRSDDVDDALNRIETSDEPVDLALVDFRNGGTSQGLKLLDAVRAHDDEQIARLRVIITTGRDENRLFSWQSGVDGFLVRPYHADELVDEVTAALGRSDDQRVAHRQEQMSGGPEAGSRRAAGEAI